jgi:Zn-dependent peptidase ImmA (M78 family)
MFAVMTMRTRREIEEKVADLLSKHGVGEAPVRVDLLARAEGLQIVEAAFDGDVSGALVRSAGVAGIAVNAKQHPNRRRFTIAHELAHYLLAHTTEDHLDWQFSILRRDEKSSEASDAKEIEANAFAANLLMPKEFLKGDLKRYINFRGELELDDAAIQTLARKYMVSEMAMTFRLVNLGFVAPA